MCYIGPMPLDLPRDLVKDGVTRTASTPAEYWDLVYRGFAVVDGPAVASTEYDNLTPAQKAARTRAQRQQQDTSNDGPTETAGNATGDES